MRFQGFGAQVVPTHNHIIHLMLCCITFTITRLKLFVTPRFEVVEYCDNILEEE